MTRGGKPGARTPVRENRHRAALLKAITGSATGVTIDQAMDVTGVSVSYVKRFLEHLVDEGRIVKTGVGKGATWRLP